MRVGHIPAHRVASQTYRKPWYPRLIRSLVYSLRLRREAEAHRTEETKQD